MSPVLDRLERLEDWRVASERRAGRMLERVANIASTLERVAAAVEGLTSEISDERAARRERRRLRAAAYAGASLLIAAGGVLAGRGL